MKKIVKKRRVYSENEIELLLKQLLPPENKPISVLSKETGISTSTLSTWKSNALKNNIESKKKKTPQDKLKIVLETYIMSEIELSKYCRENGIYLEEVKSWRVQCLEGMGSKKNISNPENKEYKKNIQSCNKKIKDLEAELKRKNEALLETVTLLALKKKLDLIFMENEEE